MENVWNPTRSRLGLMLLFFLICLFGISLNAQKNNEFEDVYDNPFKRVEKFTVYDMSREGEKVIKAFEKIGRVKRFSLSEKKGIDFSGLSESTLFFSAAPMHTFKEAETDFVVIRLNFSTFIEIIKTRNQVHADIWHKEVITRKKFLEQGMNEIIRQFSKEYTGANPQTKPAFWIYQ